MLRDLRVLGWKQQKQALASLSQRPCTRGLWGWLTGLEKLDAWALEGQEWAPGLKV